MNRLQRGVIVPVITPLDDRGAVDQAALIRLVEFLIDAGVSGLFLLGSAGEGAWLTGGQQSAIMQTASKAVAGRAAILAGVLETSTSRTVEAARIAVDNGADAVVVATPYYFEVDQAALVRHITTVARCVDSPIVLYNIPALTHNIFTMETVRTLVQIESVVAIKDSGGDIAFFESLVALKADRPELLVFQGREPLAHWSLQVGADGIVAGMANVAPRLFVDLINAAGDGAAIQAQIDQLWQLHTYGIRLACLKYAASLLGFGNGDLFDRPADLSDQDKAEIKRLMDDYEGGV